MWVSRRFVNIWDKQIISRKCKFHWGETAFKVGTQQIVHTVFLLTSKDRAKLHLQVHTGHICTRNNQLDPRGMTNYRTYHKAAQNKSFGPLDEFPILSSCKNISMFLNVGSRYFKTNGINFTHLSLWSIVLFQDLFRFFQVTFSSISKISNKNNNKLIYYTTAIKSLLRSA